MKEAVVVPLPIDAPNYKNPLLNEEYIRQDGRSPEEIRTLQAATNPIPLATCSGSVLLMNGRTVVSATIIAPKLSTARRPNNISEYLNCFVDWAPMARDFERRTTNSDPSLEVELTSHSQMLSQCLTCCIPSEAKEGTFIDVDSTVLSDDGSLESTLINAASMALMLAGISMFDFVVSCTVLIMHPKSANGEDNDIILLVDPSLLEWRSIQHQNNVSFSILIVAYACNLKKLCYFNLRGHPLTAPQLQEAFALAQEGCQAVHESLKQLVNPKQ